MSFPAHGNTISRNPNAITTKTTSDSSIQKTIVTIKYVASNIREASSTMKDVVRAAHQSGAIDELATAVHLAMIAARDTTKEIREAAKRLKERGIGDTDTTVKSTVGAGEIGEKVKHTTQQVAESAPLTAEALREVGTKVKSKRKTRSYRR